MEELNKIDFAAMEIPDSLKETMRILLNMIERQGQLIDELKKENQAQRDEINRLKGEQGKPKFGKEAGGKGSSQNSSSEKERKHAAGSDGKKKKEGKKAEMESDHTVKCEVDKSILPEDAVSKGVDRVIMQDIRLLRFNTEFLVENYYSPSQNRSYRAQLPPEYEGYFGSNLRCLIQTLYHVGDVTVSKLSHILETVGIEISQGSLNNILHADKELMQQEKRDILYAGLQNGFGQIDSTGAKEKGERQHTQIICNEFFSVFSTLPHKSREEVLNAIQGEPEGGILYSYNEQTLVLLNHLKVSSGYQTSLAQAFEMGESLNKEAFLARITAHIPKLGRKKNILTRVSNAFAIAHYHLQKDFPVVDLLMSDDAPEYKLIARMAQALCWVHDARAYKKLSPRLNVHQQILDDFLDQYWQFYARLLQYKRNPSETMKVELCVDFDQIFTRKTDYFPLDDRIDSTYQKKEELLLVLQYPHLPLHNNLAELAARRKVQKRDISIHTMSKNGTQLLDAYMSIVHTARKLKINAFDYLKDRISGKFQMQSLAQIIYANSS